MLIKKSSYNEGDIVTFKIVNGDELVATFVSQDEKEFIVTKPTTVVPNGNGIGLMPSLFSCDIDSKFPLLKTHVMLHAQTYDDMARAYTKMTSKIEIAPAGLIV